MVIEMETYRDIRKLTIDGMSQRAIAQKLDISRQTVKKYGEGETIPGNRKEYDRPARDLSLMTEPGYKRVEATPVDNFPQTAHVETVVLLEGV